MESSGEEKSSDLHIPADVRNKTALKKFRKKRAEWFELFESVRPEVVTIQRQLMDMIVLDMNYSVFTGEASRHPAGQGYAIPSLSYLLNVGYVTAQSLAARRLLDTRSDVASLTRVLADVRKNRLLVSRECFVAYDGTPYEPDLWREEATPDLELEHLIYGLEGASFSAHMRSYQRHRRFDLLSGRQSDRRDREDHIDRSVFETLSRWLNSNEAKRLKRISDNRFAHATDGGHKHFSVEETVSPIEVETAHKGFVKASRGLFDFVLNSETFVEVTPILSLGSFGTVWKDENLLPEASRMQNQWDKLAKERNEWAKSIEEDLIGSSFPEQ